MSIILTDIGLLHLICHKVEAVDIITVPSLCGHGGRLHVAGTEKHLVKILPALNLSEILGILLKEIRTG